METRTRVPRRAALATVLGIALWMAGCGGSSRPAPPPEPAAASTDTAGPLPPPAIPAPADPNQVTATAQTAEYAAVVGIPLQAVGLPASLTPAQLAVLAGEAPGLTVAAGEIRFFTGSDPGTDTTVTLQATLDTGRVIVPVQVHSTRPTQITPVVEPSEAGTLPATALQARLNVQGLGPGHALLGAALGFSVDGAPPFDPKASAATLYLPATGDTIDLAAHWVHDPVANTLTVPAGRMAELLAQVPPEELVFDIGLTSADGAFAAAWSFLGHKPAAVLHGRVVDLSGAVPPGLAGRQVAIRGMDNRTRLVARVDANGTFTAGPVVAGTYEWSLLDAHTPRFWTATVPVFPGSTQVHGQIVYAPTAEKNAPRRARATRTLSSTTQDGARPASRPIAESPRPRANAATPATCEGADAAPGEVVYQATSAQVNTTVSCVVTHPLPAGTTQVAVELSVRTDEFPYFTTTRSRYNDTWAYAVSGLPGISPASGSVNETHYTHGALTQIHCVDLGEPAGEAPRLLQANLSATNVGDSALPTSVRLTVKPACPRELRVHQATLTSPNERAYPVIAPLNTVANLPGHYLSIPIDEAVTDWGLPLTITYEPKDAVITGVRLGLMVDGAPLMSPLEQAGSISQRKPGRLTLANAVIPPFRLWVFPGKTNLLVELTGTVDGVHQTSKAEDGRIRFRNELNFVPLFLAGALIGPARRYGVDAAHPEPGRDSWATYRMLGWLEYTGYRFNDISGLHVAQTPAGRSILDHSGHSDGTQVDLRYADGSGGFTDALGGQEDGRFIQALLTAAAAEAATAGAAPRPKLVTALAWIQANRAMFEAQAHRARKMHAGPAWMKLALFDARFPNGTPIPTLTAAGALGPPLGVWTTKPPNLSFVDPHLHHWHMSLRAI